MVKVGTPYELKTIIATKHMWRTTTSCSQKTSSWPSTNRSRTVKSRRGKANLRLGNRLWEHSNRSKIEHRGPIWPILTMTLCHNTWTFQLIRTKKKTNSQTQLSFETRSVGSKWRPASKVWANSDRILMFSRNASPNFWRILWILARIEFRWKNWSYLKTLGLAASIAGYFLWNKAIEAKKWMGK